MQKTILVILFFLNSITILNAQQSDYFDQKKAFYYRAQYINNQNKVITTEKLVLVPLGRPWFFQPRLQTAIKYIYLTDTMGYKNFIHPIASYEAKNVSYLERKGKVRVKQKEVTGATVKEEEFYMHPPRANQYYMLFYSAHPRVLKRCLIDTTTTFIRGLQYFIGTFWHEYTVTPCNEPLNLFETPVKQWHISTHLETDIKEKFVEEYDRPMYKSSFDAIYTKEYGFVKLHYTFDDGVKIKFDLEEVVDL